MAIVFTMFLILCLETATGNTDPERKVELPTPEQPTTEEPDLCVGCDEEDREEEEKPQLTIEIVVDPLTGNIQYVIKGLEIE